MRIIRLFFATLAFLWLCAALLRLVGAFSRPDALSGGVSYALGYAIVPLIVFWVLAFGGRPSRRRPAPPKAPKVPNNQGVVPLPPTK